LRPGSSFWLAAVAAVCCVWVLPGSAHAQAIAALAQPLSAEPSTTQPYLACPPPAPRHAACQSVIVPPAAKLASLSASSVSPTTAGVDGSGLTPSELQSAYKLPSSTAGTGQTVAVVDAYDDPSAASDLATYRSAYGLGPCTTTNGCFSKVNQTGGTSYPPEEADWGIEISLDVDMVSAICPKCHILLIEANSNSYSDLTAAENEAAALGATEISNSWAGSEFTGETSFDSVFDHPGIPITAASGDWGYDDEASAPSYPAASPNVIAVGGTTLTATNNSRGWSESTWSRSGSGCSRYEPKPRLQTDTECSHRTTNDVAAVAEDLSVYDNGSWLAVGGTSAATPIIAAVEALSSSAARSLGAAAFYESPASLFDVTSGANGSCSGSYLCTAGPGYDGPTGVGTPDGAFPSESPSPAVSSVSPNQGPVAGATKVTITGANLTGASAVKFGSAAATAVKVESPSEIIATSPAGSGTVNVTVTTAGGQSAESSAGHYTYIAAPTVASIEPTSGPAAGGTAVTIKGSGFVSPATVKIGSSATSVEVVSETEIKAKTAAGAAGPDDVIISDEEGTSSAGPSYTFQAPALPAPTVGKIEPDQGSTEGGTTLTITGTGFTGATKVLFGSTSAPSFTVESNTSITVTTPAGTAGTVDVQVTTPSGVSATSSATHFTYGAPPTLTAVSPGSGPLAGGSSTGVTGSVWVGGSTISVQRRAALVKLDCTGTQTCSGTLKLTAQRSTLEGNEKRTRTVPIGTATFSIAPGKTSTIQLKLNATGRALLHSARGHLSATLTILKRAPVPSQTRTETVRLNLAKTKRHRATPLLSRQRPKRLASSR
jgi:hypothetical protein